MCYKSARYGENWDYTWWHVWGELGHDVPLLPVSVPLTQVGVPILILDINFVNEMCPFLLIPLCISITFSISFNSMINGPKTICETVPLCPISCHTSNWDGGGGDVPSSHLTEMVNYICRYIPRLHGLLGIYIQTYNSKTQSRGNWRQWNGVPALPILPY